jgi:hypothetical protein
MPLSEPQLSYSCSIRSTLSGQPLDSFDERVMPARQRCHINAPRPALANSRLPTRIRPMLSVHAVRGTVTITSRAMSRGLAAVYLVVRKQLCMSSPYARPQAARVRPPDRCLHAARPPGDRYGRV